MGLISLIALCVGAFVAGYFCRGEPADVKVTVEMSGWESSDGKDPIGVIYNDSFGMRRNVCAEFTVTNGDIGDECACTVEKEKPPGEET